MGRIGTAFKTDMLKGANGKVRFMDDYFIIPKGKINCVSCNQSYPVEDLVTKRLECPQCHTTSKLLIDGKEPDFFRNLGQKKIETVTEKGISNKPEEKEMGILGINFWYETKDELINSQDAKTYAEIKGKSIEEYPEGIKFVPNAHIIGMYNHIIFGDEKISELEAKTVHDEMTKRKLWERVKKTDNGKIELRPDETKVEEKKIVLDETEKAKVIKTADKEIKTERVLEKIRERLKSEKADEPKTEDEKKIADTTQSIKEEIKRVEEKETKTEKELKALKSVNRLRTKYGDALEDKIATVIVRIENRGLKLFTGNEEELSTDETDDLTFAWGLIFDKYGIENFIEWIPELAIISMHIEILGGHAYEKYKKSKSKKQKKIEEKKNRK